MQSILIIESDAPEFVTRQRAQNAPIAADFYETALRASAKDLVFSVVEPYRKALSQQDLEGVDGVIFTGSGVAWSVDAPKAAILRTAGEMVFKAGLPAFGSCNGLQLGAVLLGGKVGASPNGMEIGLAQDINLTPSGEHHPMMAGRSHGFCVPCMHRDEVQALPDAATLIAYNSHCPIQAIGYQANGVDFWGVQYHPEFPAGYVAGIVQDQVGIFSEVGNQANDLRIADTDPDAASRLGGNQKDLVEGIRVTELTNWLSHIKKVNL